MVAEKGKVVALSERLTLYSLKKYRPPISHYSNIHNKEIIWYRTVGLKSIRLLLDRQRVRGGDQKRSGRSNPRKSNTVIYGLPNVGYI